MNRFFSSFAGFLLIIVLAVQNPLLAQRQGHIDPFTLPMEFSDDSVALAGFQEKKAVVVVFTSYFCSWSVKYMDRLAQLYTDYQDQEVGFIAINSNDPDLEGRIVRTQPPEFPFLKDADHRIANIFGATKNPEAFLLVPAGNHFKVVYHGKIDDNPLDATLVRNNFLQDAIEQVLAGEKVEIKETPVAGCSIKE